MKIIDLHHEATLKKVFHDTYTSLVVFAMRYVKEKDVAEDIVQQLFYTLYKEKKSFNNKTLLTSYLYKAVKNSCLNHIASENVKNNFKINTKALLQSNINDKTAVETTALLHKAIKQLSTRRKQIIDLHLKGYDNEVIALRLDVSIQTVKNLKRKAYQNLREYLKNLGIS